MGDMWANTTATVGNTFKSEDKKEEEVPESVAI
jgi:hypothetical protein